MIARPLHIFAKVMQLADRERPDIRAAIEQLDIPLLDHLEGEGRNGLTEQRPPRAAKLVRPVARQPFVEGLCEMLEMAARNLMGDQVIFARPRRLAGAEQLARD